MDKTARGKNSNYTLYNIFTHLLLLLAPLGVPEISVCHRRDPQPFLQFPLLVDHLECNKLCCQVSILSMPDIRKVQIFYLFWLGAKIFPSPVTEDLVIQACNSNIPERLLGFRIPFSLVIGLIFVEEELNFDLLLFRTVSSSAPVFFFRRGYLKKKVCAQLVSELHY